MAKAARMLLVVLTYACAPSPRSAENPTSKPARVIAAAAVEKKSPVYDLAADRNALIETAREELGDVHSVVAQESFVLIAAPGWNEKALASSQELTVSALDAYFNHRFSKRPERAVGVYLFPNAPPYQAYCKAHMSGPCLSKYGSYHPDRRIIIMNAGLGLGTLTHELIHPIVETDFPSAPIWLNEGIASLFEAPMITGPGEITGTKNWRLPKLMANVNVVQLDALFGMSDGTFRNGSEDLHYAMARYVAQWMDEKGWLFPFYQRWRDGVSDDPTGEKAFESVTGMTPAKAHNAWIAWVKSL